MSQLLPVLFQVVLPFERLAAHFARVGDVIAVTALVDHQIVGLRTRSEQKVVEFNGKFS
jgi:hypothetical protein